MFQVVLGARRLVRLYLATSGSMRNIEANRKKKHIWKQNNRETRETPRENA